MKISKFFPVIAVIAIGIVFALSLVLESIPLAIFGLALNQMLISWIESNQKEEA